MAWNGSDGAAKPQDGVKKAKPSAWRGLLAAIIVIGGTVGVCLYFFGPEAVDGLRAKDKDRVAKIAEVTPLLPGPKSGAVSRAQEPEPQPEDGKEAVESEFEDGRVLQSTKTNGMYIVEMYRMPDGKKLKKYRYSTPSIWHSNTDQLLHMALSTPPGVTLPPIPYSSGTATKDFYDSLNTPIVINDDDSDEVREAKERVIEARETVKQLLSEGYTFEDIMADFEQQNAKDAELRREVSDRIEEIKRDGDIDMAREYMHKANEFLRESGITEVHDRSLETEEDGL